MWGGGGGRGRFQDRLVAVGYLVALQELLPPPIDCTGLHQNRAPLKQPVSPSPSPLQQASAQTRMLVEMHRGDSRPRWRRGGGGAGVGTPQALASVALRECSENGALECIAAL